MGALAGGFAWLPERVSQLSRPGAPERPVEPIQLR